MRTPRPRAEDPRSGARVAEGAALAWLAVSAIAAFSCGDAGATARARRAGPAVVLPSGARYGVEIASSPELRERGLMFRESLAADHGMLFLFPAPAIEKFWMKNCNFPIDIVWMDAGRRVTFVSAHTPPCREDPCPTYGPETPASSVLEIPDGAAAREGIAPGVRILFEQIPPPPAE
jgi:uncharacterized membrane protein (UPF0127 family)